MTAPSRADPTKMTPHWTPCSPGDPGAVERSWTQIEGDELLEPELTISDFVRAASTARPSVNNADVAQYEQWTVGIVVSFHVLEKGILFLCGIYFLFFCDAERVWAGGLGNRLNFLIRCMMNLCCPLRCEYIVILIAIVGIGAGRHLWG